jgi:hypothetical protein
MGSVSIVVNVAKRGMAMMMDDDDDEDERV